LQLFEGIESLKNDVKRKMNAQKHRDAVRKSLAVHLSTKKFAMTMQLMIETASARTKLSLPIAQRRTSRATQERLSLVKRLRATHIAREANLTSLHL